MVRIYIAGPLFSDAEKQFNLSINQMLIENGFSTFLPQKDGLELEELRKISTSTEDVCARIFQLDLSEIKKSDLVVFIMDGRVPDEGACVEIGIAYALGIECVGIKTDSRSFISGYDNPMITGALKNRIAKDLDELLSMINGITEI